MNIGIFYGTLLHANQGVNALCYSLIQNLEEIAQKSGLKFSYYMFWDVDDTYNMDNLPQELKGYDIHFIKECNTLKKKWWRYILKRKLSIVKKYLHAVKKCDIVFETGAGDSFSDTYGVGTLKYIAGNHFIPHLLKKPIIFSPQTIGPFQTKQGKKLAKNLLSKAKHVYARDLTSLEILKSYVPENKISNNVDMALFMKYTEQQKNKHSKLRIGLNPSALLWNLGNFNSHVTLYDDYKKTIRNILKLLTSNKNIEVVMVAHVATGNGENPIEDDYWLNKLLKYEFPEIEIGPFFYTPTEAKSFLSTLDGVIASRMHCCIGGYSAGVPVFPLAYSRKFSGLFNKDLDYHYGSDLQEKNSDETIEALSKFISERSSILDEMPQRLEVLKKHELKFVESLYANLQEIFPEKFQNK